MGWFVAAVCLFCVLVVMACVRVGAEADDAMRIMSEKFVTATPAPVPLPEKWVRYDVNLSDDLQRYIEGLCKEYEIPASIVMAIIEVESDCDASLVGDNGNSWGLMQIYSSQHTARMQRLGAYDLLDPKMNVLVGIDYLHELIQTGHDYEWVLSWYNGHGGNECEYSDIVLDEAQRLAESCQVVVEGE